MTQTNQSGNNPGTDAQLLLAFLLQNELAAEARRQTSATLQALTGPPTYRPSSSDGIVPGNPISGTPLSFTAQPYLSSPADRSFRPNHSIPKLGSAAPVSWAGSLPQTRSTSPITQPSLSERSGSESGDFKPVIRKEKVEAALRSSPQRGRKRTNLNAMERQELIRNRNREHAKETRLRKKMRQEELEEKEQKLLVHEEMKGLEQARRRAVIQYVECRQRMLQSLSSHLDGEVSNDDSAQEDAGDDDIDKGLYKVIHDVNSFEFNVGKNESQGNTSVGRLCSHDLDLANKVKAQFGNSALASVQYLVHQGAKNVSLDCFDGGVVEIEVVLSTQPQVPIQQGFLRFQFAGPESHKLSSVHWRVTEESLTAQPRAMIVQDSVLSMNSSRAVAPIVVEATNGSNI
eukprot:scaffold5357_cov208-Amphora_coffeaeformis.AAC.27